MKRIIIASIIIVVSTVLLGNVACQRKQGTYRIGAILPMSGNLAVFGENERNGIVMAQEELLKKGDIKLEILYEDSKGVAKDGVSAANKLIDIDKCQTLLTSLSGVSLAVQPIIDKSKVIQFPFCMDPDIADKSGYTFRIYPNMWQETNLMTEYIQMINAKKIAVLHVAISSYEMEINEYLMPRLRDRDIKIVSRETFQFDDIDVRPQAYKIKQAQPDLLILLVYPNQYPLVFDALKKTGLLGKVPIMCTISLSFQVEIPANLLEDIVFISPSFTLQEQSAFVTAYKEKYDKDPTFDAAYAYDVIMILAQALNKAGHSSDAITQALTTIKDYKGASGSITILPNGDARVAMELGIIKNGKRVPYINNK